MIFDNYFLILLPLVILFLKFRLSYRLQLSLTMTSKWWFSVLLVIMMDVLF